MAPTSLVLLGIGLGVVVAALVLMEPNVPPLDDDVEPIHMAVDQSALIEEIPATLSITWSPPPAGIAPAWEGIVTAVHVQPGDTVTSGTTAVELNGIRTLAVHTDTPLWRPILRTTRGPDVDVAAALLAELGHLDQQHESGEIFGEAGIAAAQSLAAELGVPGEPSLLDPTWFVWMSAPSVTVDDVLVTVGAPAPGPGAPVFVGRPVVADAQLRFHGPRPAPGSDPAEFVADEFDLVVQLDGQYTLADASLGELDDLDASQAELTGVVRIPREQRATTVPASAVSSDARGSSYCVWVLEGEQNRAVAVDVVAGDLGSVQVVGELGAAPRVLVNPAQALPDSTCPSS